MSIVQPFAAFGLTALVLLQQSPQGSAATRDAFSRIDRAAADVRATDLFQDISFHEAGQLLERLHEVTREGLSRGVRLPYPYGPPREVSATT